jgi:hypothetical protein
VVKAASGTASAGAARRLVPNADANAHLILSSIFAQKYVVSLGGIASFKKSVWFIQE